MFAVEILFQRAGRCARTVRKEKNVTKSELLSYKYIKKELEGIEREIKSLKNVSSHLDELSELSEMYEEKKAQLFRTQIAIENTICSLQSNLASLMRMRYIECKKWYTINAELNISEDTSMRWHRIALRKINNIKS